MLLYITLQIIFVTSLYQYLYPYHQHISDKDAIGRVRRKPYMNFFQSVKYHFDQTLLTQPSGVTATNKNYDYANSKFIEQLD